MSCMKNDFPEQGRMEIDYEDPALPQSVRTLKPILYREDAESYCCILGPDPEQGIFGCGPTLEAALKSWDDAFQNHEARCRVVEERYRIVQVIGNLRTAWKRAL